jgi:serine/threonine protein kinase
VNLGKKLGTGGFCSVFEVTGFDLFSELASKSEQAHLSNMKEFHTRDYMSNNHTRRNSFDKDEARYAVKRLSEKTLASEDLFQKGVADLAIEAHFLAVIQHRNIVKVRGYALGDFCNDSFFIMMDRLYDTLDSAIRKWKERSKKNSSIFTRGGKQKTADLFSERIEYAWEIANAAEFLHFKK